MVPRAALSLLATVTLLFLEGWVDRVLGELVKKAICVWLGFQGVQ